MRTPRAPLLGAALLAAAALVPEAPAAEGVAGRLVLRESVTQRFGCRTSDSVRACAVDEARTLDATFDLGADPADVATYSDATRVSLRIGAFRADAAFEDDPAFNPLRRVARLALPPDSAGRAGSVVVRWTGGHVTVRVRARAAALLADVDAAPGRSAIEPPLSAVIAVGEGSWFFAGVASGRARVQRLEFDGGARDLVRARVQYAGTITAPASDVVPPTLAIGAPTAGSITAIAPVVVSGTAFDDRGIQSVTWTFDGGAATEAAFSVNTTTPGPDGQLATFGFDVPVAAEGAHVLRVTVADVAGNTVSQDVPFTYAIPRPFPLAAGKDFSGVVRDGAALLWGGDGFGQLGNGADGPKPLPTAVEGFGEVVALAAGSSHVVALAADGTVWTCGSDDVGQLGDGSQVASPVPIQVPGLTGVVDVAAGYFHSVALRADGTVWCWGSNTWGESGDGAVGYVRTSPVQAQGVAGAVAVTAGYEATLALLGDGSVVGWGTHRYGQLGFGGGGGQYTPITILPGNVLESEEVVEIAAGSAHVLARRADGRVWAWGYSLNGSLGESDPKPANFPTPFLMPGIDDAVALGVCNYTSAVLREDATVLAWGYNAWGALADGTTTQRNTPAPVAGLTDVVRLSKSCAASHFLAQRADNVLLGWGAYTVGPPVDFQGSGNVYHLAVETIPLE